MGTISGTLEDREEIRDLYTRYVLTLDGGRRDEWIDCFTENGAFESQRFGKHLGHDGLRKFFAIYRESLGGAQGRHVITAIHFTIEGDRASGGCYLTYYHSKNGRTGLAAVGHYEDELRKDAGAWRFESRRVLIDGPAG
jgi:3-phenylpropionate/cinnamic acid dioxygenase small subunit